MHEVKLESGISDLKRVRSMQTPHMQSLKKDLAADVEGEVSFRDLKEHAVTKTNFSLYRLVEFFPLTSS